MVVINFKKRSEISIIDIIEMMEMVLRCVDTRENGRKSF